MGADVNWIKEIAERLRDNIKIVIKGKDETIEKIVIAFLTGGHILLEDVPGSGKTVLAKTFAASLDGTFQRVQMTPDLLPADLTGVNVFQPKTSEFTFVKGPVFTNILLADEINRATPKTQAGLLECMEEGQVTIDGKTWKLQNPFMVIATENPVDTQGVFPLPEAQIDRFLMKLSMEYPNHDSMVDIFRTHVDENVLQSVSTVVTLEDVRRAKDEIKKITIHEDIVEYAVNIVEATREKDYIVTGVSQRGGIALLRTARTVAAVRARDYVLPDDIKYVAKEVLAHRMILRNSMRMKQTGAKDVVQDILEQVPVPTEEI